MTPVTREPNDLVQKQSARRLHAGSGHHVGRC